MKSSKDSLIKTKWEYRITDNCISHITFKSNNTYEEYNCERDNTFKGKYELKRDTLYLIEIGLESELPGKNREVVKGRSIYRINDTLLKYIGWQDFNDGIWSKFSEPKIKIVYKKVEGKEK